MKYLSLILLPILCTACGYNPYSPPQTGLEFYSLFWTLDETNVIAAVDTFSSSGTSWRIQVYSKSGTLIQSFFTPDIASSTFSEIIWGTKDDSTFFFTSLGSSNDFLFRHIIATDSNSIIAGGVINGESFDRNHLLIFPVRSQNGSQRIFITDISTAKPRVQGSWMDNVHSGYGFNGNYNAVWMGNKSVGYFRFNELNLVDFVIVDTNGSKLDSFDLAPLKVIDNVRAMYGPGTLYFAGDSGILKYDSSSKAFSFLTHDYIYSNDISPDGNFITASKSSALVAINTQTGISKVLANVPSKYLTISPSGNKLAFVDLSNSYYGFTGKLVVIPVSAP